MFLQSSFSKLSSSTSTANSAAGSFLPDRSRASLPLLCKPCVQVGRGTCREGSLESRLLEELWACVQCLEPGQSLDAPCLCLCSVVNVFVLSLKEARALFGLSASISEPQERMFRAVCQNPCGAGEHPHLLMDLFPRCLV